MVLEQISIDENRNAHRGNALYLDYDSPRGSLLAKPSPTGSRSVAAMKHRDGRGSFGSQGVAAQVPKRPPTPKTSSRSQHKEKILKLCEEKLTASSESKKIVESIKTLYKTKILPLEKKYHLHSLCLPTSGTMQNSEFDARPSVLLLGQYSTGKTSFIRHLLGVDFPGMHIGPEPTSDKFMALIHGKERKIIKGNTLTVMPELPFFGLSQFGSTFLNHFNGSVTESPLLQFMNMVDTPGILSGEKQRLSREYPFSKTAKWFADRSDLILLLFDAHKLDISDEFKEVVETIRPHNDDKIRCVLNKADSVEKDQMVRVYGSLMWSMGKLFSTPEVVRVYTGSFWDKPLVHDDFQDMFNADEEWLLDELMRLPSVSAERKVNAVVKRIRLIKVHLCILGHVRKNMPKIFGHAASRKGLLQDLDKIFEIVRNQYQLPEGDMPDVQAFRERLSASFEDFRVFPQLDLADLEAIDEIMSSELPAIMRGASNVTEKHPEGEAEEKSNHFPAESQTSSIPTMEMMKKESSKKAMSTIGIIWLCVQVVLNLIFLGMVAGGCYLWLDHNGYRF